MRTKFLSSTILAGVALLVAPLAAQGAVVLSDDFNDGVFASHWVLTALSCGSPAETGGQLVMNKTASCAGGIAMATDAGLYPIRGDFEAVVDFDLPSFNLNGALRVASFAMRTADDAHQAVIERYNRQTGDGAPNAFNYKAWIDVSLNSSPAVAWTATTHLTGKFRIARTGGTATLSYWNGSSWVLMKSGAFPTDDVQLVLTTSSGPFVNGAWTARWDNLVVNSAETVPPPAVCLTDAFENGVLDVPLHAHTGCGTVTESGGKLRLANNTSCAGGVSARSSKNELRLCGDFDIAVDLRKIVMGTPSTGGWFYTGISLGDTTFASGPNRAAIEWHNRFANGDCMFTSAVKSWIGDPINCSSSVRATGATAVRFRIQRVGSRLRMFQNQGPIWVLERASNFTTQPLLFELFAGSGTAGNPITIDFDNLEARCRTEDDAAPVIAIPADAQYACAADVPPLSLDGVTASATHANGAVSVTVVETSNEGAGSPASPLVLQRHFTATDLCMHSTTAIQTLTVIDDVAPSIVVPGAVAPVAVPGIGPCPSVVSNETIGTATGEDNCGPVTIAVGGVPAGNLFPEGATILTWTATDAVGNVSSATQSVTFSCPRATIAGEVLRTCNGATTPVEGVVVELILAGDVLAQTASGADGSWSIADVRSGTYVVRVGTLAGFAVPIDSRLVSVGSAGQTASVESFTFTCLLGDLAGGLTSTCDGNPGPVEGITVDAYREDSGGHDVLVATTTTDAAGAWSFDDLALGDYTVSVVPPLGFAVTPASIDATLATPDGLVNLTAFALACQAIAAEPRSMGYWKHQVNVYLTGKGSAQESLEDMLSYIDLIVERFNENPAHPVALYDAGVVGTNDRLRELQRLLTVNRGGTGNDRARQQLLALLLNVVSLKISQSEVVTADGANVSQVITHCYDLVDDGLASNDETAKDIAEAVNVGSLVPAGRVPLSTPYIGYRDPGAITPAAVLTFAFGGARPNPSRGAVSLSFSLDSDDPVVVELFDVTGRRALVHAWQGLGAGVHALPLPGSAGLRSGVYGVRLTHGDRIASGRLIRLE